MGGTFNVYTLQAVDNNERLGCVLPVVDTCHCGMQYLEDEDIQEIMNFIPASELSLVIHHTGALDGNKWKPAFQRKYGEEWEFKGAAVMSKYTTLIYDVQASYFRIVVENGNGKVRCWDHILGGSVDCA